MQLEPQLQAKLDAFAKAKNLSAEEAISEILKSYFRSNPSPSDTDDGLSPDQLNASNDG